MSGHAEWLRTGATIATTLLGSSVVTALIQWRRLGPLTKAKAAKIEQETRSAGVDDQTQIIGDLREELKRLGDRVSRLEGRNDALEQRNVKLREALLRIAAWVQRAWVVLTPEQRTLVGPPPDTDIGP